MKKITTSITLGLAISAVCTAQQNKQPNIIFILADDLGIMDINFYAKHFTNTPFEKQFYDTPYINKLASEGISFSNAYVCPLCAPTRSSILTGKYASRIGFQTATAGSANTYYAQGITPPTGFHEQDCYWADKIENEEAVRNGYTLIALPSGQPQDNGRNEITIAEALTEYHSAFIGKWHLGGHGSEGYQPHNQGFEELSYFDAGGSFYFNWENHWTRKEKFFPKMRQKELQQGKVIDNNKISYLTDDLTQTALNFIDRQVAKNDSKPFFLYFCEFAVHSPWQAPDSTISAYDKKLTKGWNGQSNATYAAMIKHLDNSVGRIMDKLYEKGIDKNTVVVFMSDNGGITVQKGTKNDVKITDNTPFAGQKANVYEGGIKTPLIYWYKGKIKAGQWSDVVVDCNDIFPTLLELAGAPKPAHAIDGQSIVPLFSDPNNRDKKYNRDTFFWHYPLSVVYKNPEDMLPFTPQSAVRKGDYKLIFDWYGRLKLYNVVTDISETNNLIFEMPDKTKEMFAILMNYLEKNVEKKYWPTPNTEYKPSMEVRKTAYIDIIKLYREGGDIVACQKR